MGVFRRMSARRPRVSRAGASGVGFDPGATRQKATKGDGPPVELHPVGEQRRLPEPGGRADQHELAYGRRPQPLQEAGAGYPTLA